MTYLVPPSSRIDSGGFHHHQRVINTSIFLVCYWTYNSISVCKSCGGKWFPDCPPNSISVCKSCGGKCGKVRLLPLFFPLIIHWLIYSKAMTSLANHKNKWHCQDLRSIYFKLIASYHQYFEKFWSFRPKVSIFLRMKTELVFIPLPAISHLVSTVQFAKLLVGRDEELSIKILTFKVPFDANANTYMESLHAAESIRGVQYVQLPDSPLAIDSEGNPQNPFHFMSRLIDSQKPQVRKVVSRSSRLAGVVVDMFCTPMIDVANEFDMPTYVFYTSGAAVIGIRHHIQSLIDDKFDINQVKDSDFEFSVSTYINPVPAKLCPSPMLDDSGLILYHTRRLVNESKGIIVNTFLELESYAIQGLISNKKMPKIYPIGPLINSDSKTNNQDSDIILRWLDDQPISSVVFLCFGSYGSFEGEQVKEIASALEQSGCRFLWSLRRPPLNEPSAEYPGEYQYHKEVLPEGFLERTSTVGKVIGWAPQTRVLAHPAVGGFVTHCGWNSVLESVWFGVPMAAWPMYAEQQLNALFLVKDLGIASEIKLDYKLDIMSRSAQVIVRADEIESGIRNLMQPGMRVKAKELMEKARTSLQEGGSSNISLGRLIEDFHGSDEGGH